MCCLFSKYHCQKILEGFCDSSRTWTKLENRLEHRENIPFIVTALLSLCSWSFVFVFVFPGMVFLSTCPHSKFFQSFKCCLSKDNQNKLCISTCSFIKSGGGGSWMHGNEKHLSRNTGPVTDMSIGMFLNLSKFQVIFVYFCFCLM